MALSPEERSQLEAELVSLKAQYAQIQQQKAQQQNNPMMANEKYRERMGTRQADRAIDLAEKADNLTSLTPSLLQNIALAKNFSKVAPEGALAENKVWFSRNNPWGNKEQANAAASYERVVGQNILSNLKSTFGQSPTDAELKALTKLEGSLTLSDKERQSLLDFTARAASRKQKIAQAQADRAMAGNPLQGQELLDYAAQLEQQEESALTNAQNQKSTPLMQAPLPPQAQAMQQAMQVSQGQPVTQQAQAQQAPQAAQQPVTRRVRLNPTTGELE